MGKRQETALRIRDSVLKKLAADGEPYEAILGPLWKWRGEGFLIFLRTPETNCDRPGYGLYIRWQGRTAFNFEWHEDGHFRIVTFKRGNWEQKLLAFDAG